jgi:hypothetical protein
MSGIGPSAKVRCRVLNQSSCGSGSLVGMRGGKGLICTNAHVAGTRLGRVVKCYFPELSRSVDARVIMAAYSSRTLADWAILETVDDFSGLTPVPLSKARPTGSHYTRGFPRCRSHDGTDISTVDMSDSTPLWRWNPNAIGGQSGSGVWSDSDDLQYAILTWSWGGYGAGQMTAEVYRQAKNRTTAGHPRYDGLVELDEEADFDFSGIDRATCDDPIVEDGFFAEAGITDLPIWAEDNPTDPEPDPESDGPNLPGLTARDWIEYCRDIEEIHEKWRKKYEGDVRQENPPAGGGGGSGGDGLIGFG